MIDTKAELSVQSSQFYIFRSLQKIREEVSPDILRHVRKIAHDCAILRPFSGKNKNKNSRANESDVACFAIRSMLKHHSARVPIIAPINAADVATCRKWKKFINVQQTLDSALSKKLDARSRL